MTDTLWQGLRSLLFHILLWMATALLLPLLLVSLLLGHGLNFILAVASGFIHGLRLNVIEFFKWGVKEEGHAYRPFEQKESNSG